MTPPAVLLRRISCARARSRAGRRATRVRIPSSRAMSSTVRRVIPSSTPRSGVRSSPSTSAKTLKPGPSVDVALGVGEDRQERVAVVGLEEPADEVAPLEVLDPRVDHLGRHAPRLARDDDVDARLLLLGPREPDVGDRVRVEARLQAARVALAARRHAAGHDRLDVRLAQPAAADDLGEDLDGLVTRQRRLQPDALAAALEAVEVVVEPEEAAAPDPDDVVGEVRADEAGVEDRDAGLGDRDVLALDPGVAVVHARPSTSSGVTSPTPSTTAAASASASSPGG